MWNIQPIIVMTSLRHPYPKSTVSEIFADTIHFIPIYIPTKLIVKFSENEIAPDFQNY